MGTGGNVWVLRGMVGETMEVGGKAGKRGKEGGGEREKKGREELTRMEEQSGGLT